MPAEERKSKSIKMSASKPSKRKLEVLSVLLLCLFYRILSAVDCQTSKNHRDQRHVASQHMLTRFYHDVQQNEIYKRHDLAASGSGSNGREAASSAPPSSTQEISLRQVLVPLLSRPTQMNSLRPQAAEGRVTLLDYKSSNNRGPANAAPSHQETPPTERHKSGHFVDPSWRFGERRRQDVEPAAGFRVGPKEGRTGQARATRKSTSWSQPDPRTSYSLPISLVAVPKSGREGAGRRAGQAVGRLLSTGIGGGTLTLSSEALKRNEPESAAWATSEQNVSSSTPAAELNVTSFESGESENDLVSDHYQQPDAFVRQQKSMKTPAADEDEIQAKSAVFGVATGGASQPTQRQQTAPMVTLIRYVPVVMNVPAERLAVLSNGQKVSQQAASGKQLLDMSSTIAPSVLDQIYRQHSEQASNKLQTLTSAKYHLIDSLLPTANEPKVAPAPGQPTILDHTPSDISSEYSHLYPASSALQLGNGQPTLALAANGQQLTRLAYIPVGQPQLALPSGHATSKALSAYASRLISMLRPSSLLSSIGASSSHAGAHFGHQQQQQPTMPHIYLLAPAEPLVPPTSSMLSTGATIKPTGRPAGHQVAGSFQQQKPEDTLLNQASKVHSTKSQRQPASSAQQMRWPLGPQMNGLVCIQGLIKTKQPAKQQQQPMSQKQIQEDEVSSFDYDRPQQQTEQQASKSADKQPAGGKSPATPAKGKSSKGGEQKRGRMSPIRMMQKMANKKLKSASQQYESAGSYMSDEQEEQRPMPITQQKLMSSSSDNNSIMDSREQETSARQQQQLQSLVQSRPPHQLQLEQQEQEAKRSNIIPFTIRDKIDVPTSRARAVRLNTQAESATIAPTPSSPSQSNGPVQYDEPSETDLNMASRSGAPADLDQHWSRTSFVSSSPRSIGAANLNGGPSARRNQQSASFSTEINYRKESQGGSSNIQPNGLSNDFALPVLMASSSPASSGQSRERDPRSRPSVGQDSQANSYNNDEHRTTTPAFLRPSVVFSRAAGLAASGPPPQRRNEQAFSNFQSGVRFASHELLGSPSSASSISTTTTSGLPTPTESPPTRSLAGTSPTPTLEGHSKPGQTAGDLGQLISSISLSRDPTAGQGSTQATNAAVSGQEQQQQQGATSAPPGSSPADTVELVINSTPREPAHTTPAMEGQDYFVGQNITASPLYPTPPTTTAAPTSTMKAERGASVDEEAAGQSEWLASMNSFSHDRTLSSGSAAPGAQFGRISESLQTNPLDLIDLQNSRSSFELPAQLESLSMFHAGAGDQSSGPQSRPELEPSESARQERREPLTTSAAAGQSRTRHPNHRNARHAAARIVGLKRAGKLAGAAQV